MLKFHNFDIVFQEIPDETTLAINLTGCPFRCQGCHSPHLWEDTGRTLDAESLEAIYGTYRGLVTCIALMGGDAHPDEVQALSKVIRQKLGLKSAWYSGAAALPAAIDPKEFDFIKIGPYETSRGGLKSQTTNQRLYRILADGAMVDITAKIRQKPDLG